MANQEKIDKLWSLFKLLGFEENKLYRYDYMNKSNLEESRFWRSRFNVFFQKWTLRFHFFIYPKVNQNIEHPDSMF